MSILVVAEHQGGGWHPITPETAAAGQALGRALEAPVSLLILGEAPADLVDEAARWEINEVISVRHPLLEAYTPDAHTAALVQAVEQLEPRYVLFPHTYQVRDFGPKAATRLGKGFISDVIEIRTDPSGPVFVRQLFQGKLNADVVPEGDPPVFASIQAGAYRADQIRSGDGAAPARDLSIELDASQVRTKPLDRFREAAAEVDLGSAEIIVSVGRGIQDPDNLPLAEKLAAALGGELAGSRPVIDNGWLPLERQVGSSGQAVSPKLYLALGISGAIQHVVGMKGSQTIVAVNKDESAPIFEIADYGIVGDLFEVVPALLDELSKSDTSR